MDAAKNKRSDLAAGDPEREWEHRVLANIVWWKGNRDLGELEGADESKKKRRNRREKRRKKRSKKGKPLPGEKSFRTISGLMQAKSKFSKMFKTMSGTVKLKGLTAKEFDESASLHTALQEALLNILIGVGLQRSHCRVKLQNAQDCEGAQQKVSVSYLLRLRGEAKELADAVLMALKTTFT